MPELPEVETVRRGLAAVLEGATIIAVDQRRAGLRFPFPPDFPARLIGHRIEWLERRAKYLRAYLDSDEVLLMHLGMSGSFRIDAASPETPGAFHYPRHGGAIHDHVVFALSNGASVTYHDPRRFGFMLLAARNALSEHPLFVRLGVEPLDSGFSGVTVARLFSGRATTLKAALLDQTLVAGLGNIYVCEALHRAKLSPRRAAGTLARHDGSPTKGAHLLASVIKDVLSEAVAAGGSSLRDHRQADGQLGYFQHRFRVYDREGDPCPDPRCAGVVERIVQNGRSTFFCPACQR